MNTQQNHMQSNWHFSTYQWPMRHWTCPFRLLFHQTCIISFILHLEAFRFTEFIRFQNVPIYMWIDIQDSLICQFLRYRVLNNRWSGKVFQLNSFWYRDWQWQWTVKLCLFVIFRRVFGILNKKLQDKSCWVYWMIYYNIDVLNSSVCRLDAFLDIS